jgi:signal peptidase II
LNPPIPTPPEKQPASAAPDVPPSAIVIPPTAAATSIPIGRRVLAYRTLLLLALAVFVADQATKSWIVSRLHYPTYGEAGGAIPVVRGFFYLVHVGNTGAAWSMFTGRSVLLASLAGATLVAIFLWRKALGLHHGISQVAFGLLCGGIVGNLVDRVRHQHVIDFIDLHFGSYVYPTFNVADSGICIGVILYLWHSLRTAK